MKKLEAEAESKGQIVIKKPNQPNLNQHGTKNEWKSLIRNDIASKMNEEVEFESSRSQIQIENLIQSLIWIQTLIGSHFFFKPSIINY